jgi:hypothetical protein
VVVLRSIANLVRDVDAHDGSGIWQASFRTPVAGSTSIDMWTNHNWGCIATGVIDPDLERLYRLSHPQTSVNATPGSIWQAASLP